MKPALFHPKARAVLKGFPDDVRREIGKAIFDLQKGTKLSMPLSRPMPSVAAGVEELRMKDRSGAYCGLLLHQTGDGGLDLPRISKEDSEDAAARHQVSACAA